MHTCSTEQYYELPALAGSAKPGVNQLTSDEFLHEWVACWRLLWLCAVIHHACVVQDLRPRASFQLRHKHKAIVHAQSSKHLIHINKIADVLAHFWTSSNVFSLWIEDIELESYFDDLSVQGQIQVHLCKTEVTPRSIVVQCYTTKSSRTAQTHTVKLVLR